MTGKKISKEELENLLETNTINQITEQTGLSKHTIYTYMSLYGLKVKKREIKTDYPPVEEYARLRYKDRLFDYEIAHIWNISRSTMYHIRNDYGLPVFTKAELRKEKSFKLKTSYKYYKKQPNIKFTQKKYDKFWNEIIDKHGVRELINYTNV